MRLAVHLGTVLVDVSANDPTVRWLDLFLWPPTGSADGFGREIARRGGRGRPRYTPVLPLGPRSGVHDWTAGSTASPGSSLRQ